MAAPLDMDSLKSVIWRRGTKRQLLARDGFLCWLCGKIMALDDATIAHLGVRAAGGGDDLGDLVLCHTACDKRLANRPLAQKVRMRARRRRKPSRRRRST